MADEIAWLACVFFGASCLLSYMSLRVVGGDRTEAFADKAFLAGLAALFASVVVLALNPPV